MIREGLSSPSTLLPTPRRESKGSPALRSSSSGSFFKLRCQISAERRVGVEKCSHLGHVWKTVHYIRKQDVLMCTLGVFCRLLVQELQAAVSFYFCLRNHLYKFLTLLSLAAGVFCCKMALVFFGGKNRGETRNKIHKAH